MDVAAVKKHTTFLFVYIHCYKTINTFLSLYSLLFFLLFCMLSNCTSSVNIHLFCFLACQLLKNKDFDIWKVNVIEELNWHSVNFELISKRYFWKVNTWKVELAHGLKTSQCCWFLEKKQRKRQEENFLSENFLNTRKLQN